MTLGFIGLGNMGLAILKGIKGSESDISVYGYDVSSYKKPLTESLGGAFLSSEVEVVQMCKYILLGVKPQSVDEVLEKIAPSLTEESVIVSICAGISSEYIRSRTGKGVKVVLVMPNMPMMLGEGASAVSTDALTSNEELEFVCRVFKSCCPAVEIIPPEKMNEIICINGSSPAFIYLFAKSFTDYARENGIDERAAMSLFSQSLIGAGRMLTDALKREISVDTLISQVSSKGGTTVAGLERLTQGQMPETIFAACEACTKRATELGKH
ncbi:MAG: pyrroline-5-carboxylate reductase [Oscillospiraceae bacterium]|nr:pyrroline-5-carboxylate reductase [Oscillospiraceae bacterium]